MKTKIIIVATVPISINILLKGKMKFLKDNNFKVYCVYGKDNSKLNEFEYIEKAFPINLTRKISVFNDLLAIIQLIKIIYKIKPDIVHSYTPKAGLIAMVASNFIGTRIRLHNITGLPLIEKKGLYRKLLILIEKLIFFNASQVYVNSTALKSFIEANISKNVKILGYGSTNGIDVDYWENSDSINRIGQNWLQKKEIRNNEFIWLFIGRLVKEKGIEELITAFLKFKIELPNSKLILVGNFEDDLYPLDKSVKLEIENNSDIISTGFISDVRPFLSIADCFLFPSYREGLPNVVLQACCFDLPIIASNINGCNEIVEHYINGILIEPKSSFDLFNAMKKIFLDSDLRYKFRLNTRKITINKYDQKEVWISSLKEYENLLNNV